MAPAQLFSARKWINPNLERNPRVVQKVGRAFARQTHRPILLQGWEVNIRGAVGVGPCCAGHPDVGVEPAGRNLCRPIKRLLHRHQVNVGLAFNGGGVGVQVTRREVVDSKVVKYYVFGTYKP